MLIILDGFGHSDHVDHNAIKLARTPNLNKLFNTDPNSLLETSGESVGLPHGIMGNSEVGHLNLVLHDIEKQGKATKFFSVQKARNKSQAKCHAEKQNDSKK